MDVKVGDIITCYGNEDAVNRMLELAKVGVETDFLYVKDSKHGIWLEVVKEVVKVISK